MNQSFSDPPLSRTEGLPSKHSMFRTTRWDLIRLAQGEDEEQVYEGMERLAKTYWYPLYAYACRQGVKRADAQDVTQGFLAGLVDGNYLASVRPEKGRFRSHPDTTPPLVKGNWLEHVLDSGWVNSPNNPDIIWMQERTTRAAN